MLKTPKQLEQHLENIHRNPLVCSTLGCSHRKPFGKQSDLNRHIRSVHLATYDHDCPYEDCSQAFKRQDKLKKHLRECHPQVRCLLHHCSATIPDIQREVYQAEAHGTYECALGLCKDNPSSRFSWVAFRRHLRLHHKMSLRLADATWMQMSEFGEKTFTVQYIRNWQARYPKSLSSWSECSVCLLQQEASTADDIAAGSHDGNPGAPTA